MHLTEIAHLPLLGTERSIRDAAHTHSCRSSRTTQMLRMPPPMLSSTSIRPW